MSRKAITTETVISEPIPKKAYQSIEAALDFVNEEHLVIEEVTNLFELEQIEIKPKEEEVAVVVEEVVPEYKVYDITLRNITFTYDESLAYINMSNFETLFKKYAPNDDLNATLKAFAQMVYGEAGGCCGPEQAAVAWTVMNRYDEKYAKSILGVITASGQFHGYKAHHPVKDEIYDICKDVIMRWMLEKEGNTNVGRVLPAGYNWFWGDGKHNYFRSEYKSSERWDWSLPVPYSK